jgi:Bacterial Ig-like domain
MKRTNLSKTPRLLVGAALISLASMSLVQAGDVTVYGIGKNQVYEQTSASAVTPASSGAYSFSAFAIPTSADSISFVTVTPPSGDTQYLDSTSSGFQMESPFATPAELNAAFPSGQYTFTAQSMDFTSTAGPANLTLSGDAYPATTPQISNYAAAQSVDPAKDFVVSWNAFANATANDFVQLTLQNDSGDVVFDTGLPGQSTALPGTALSATIPANKLTAGSSYDAVLRFGHITSRDATDYPGGTGVTTYAQETRFTVATTGGISGIPGLPPFLIFTSPATGAKNVALDSPVVFTFTVPMAPVQAITWSPNVVAANFSYTWSPSATNLTAQYNTALPANATITWTLDPSVFKSQSGTALFAVNLSGSFTTGSSQSNTNSPCNGGSTNTGIGSLSISKNVRYVQTNANPPVVDTESGAGFFAFLQSPATNPVTQVTLQLPNGTIKTLTNLFGFVFFEQFASQEALDAAYPAGNYTVNMTRTTGTAALTLSLAANGAPPTPQITNFAQTQNFDPTADLTVQWLPFAGAAAYDSIYFDMSDTTAGTDFHAPDPCIPRDLPNTATSIVVPKNTFGAGADIDGSLGFNKIGSLNTNSVPGLVAFADYSKTTSFKATTSGGSQPNPPSIQNLVRLQNGTVQFQVQGTAGATLSAEASTDLKSWTPIMSAPSTSGLLPVTDSQAASMPYRFYRGKEQ